MIRIDAAVLERVAASRPEQVLIACRMCRVSLREDGLDLGDALRVLLHLLLEKIEVPETRRLWIGDLVEPYCHEAVKRAVQYLQRLVDDDTQMGSLTIYLAENRYLIVPDAVYDLKTKGKPTQVKGGLPRPFFGAFWDLTAGCLMLILEQAHSAVPAQQPSNPPAGYSVPGSGSAPG